jgi:hypothetical protein
VRLTKQKYVRNVKAEEIPVCRENWKESADERGEDRISKVKITEQGLRERKSKS